MLKTLMARRLHYLGINVSYYDRYIKKTLPLLAGMRFLQMSVKLTPYNNTL